MFWRPPRWDSCSGEKDGNESGSVRTLRGWPDYPDQDRRSEVGPQAATGPQSFAGRTGLPGSGAGNSMGVQDSTVPAYCRSGTVAFNSKGSVGVSPNRPCCSFQYAWLEEGSPANPGSQDQGQSRRQNLGCKKPKRLSVYFNVNLPWDSFNSFH